MIQKKKYQLSSQGKMTRQQTSQYYVHPTTMGISCPHKRCRSDFKEKIMQQKNL